MNHSYPLRPPARLVAATCTIILAVLAIPAPATAQTTHPASDATVDWLLTSAKPAGTTQPVTTQPATAPAGPVASPFASRPAPDALGATLTFSDESVLAGAVTTTEGKPIRIWDEARAEYRDVPLKLVKTFEAKLLWERDEPEWKFIESGSDLKEMTGRTYPARELTYVVTLVNDQRIEGGIVAPLYFTGQDGKSRTLVLHKRQKGEVGQNLTDLKFLKRVEIK